MPTHIVKVFVKGDEQKHIKSEYQVVEPYQAFLLIRATDAQLKKLSTKYPVQDITSDYEVHTPYGAIGPVVSATASLEKGRRVAAEKGLPTGPHHYLIQFIGPIKQSWLAGVTKAGGTLRTSQNDFTWVVLADKKALPKIGAALRSMDETLTV
jgi:serine protease AprX